MNMNALTKTQKIAASAGVLLCVMLGAYYLLFTSIKTLTQEVVELRSHVTENMVRQRADEEIARFLKETEDSRSELLTYIPNTNDPTPFLSVIESLGNDAGVELEVSSITEEVLSVGSESKDGQSDTAPGVFVELRVEGGFAHLYHLLALLEHMPYATSIVHTALTKSSETSVWEGQVRLHVTVRTPKQ
jgi:ribosomal protein S15P/S13E